MCIRDSLRAFCLCDPPSIIIADLHMHTSRSKAAAAEVAARRLDDGVSASKLFFTPSQLHCDGIWLHAKRYWVEEGDEQWAFDAPPPPWGEPSWDGAGSGY